MKLLKDVHGFISESAAEEYVKKGEALREKFLVRNFSLSLKMYSYHTFESWCNL